MNYKVRAIAATRRNSTVSKGIVYAYHRASKPFGFQHGEWEAQKAELKPGDELWTFTSPPESWKRLMGRAGIALVRVNSKSLTTEPFRKLFLDVLAGKEPDANHDGYVTGTELGLFLHQKMTNLTNNRQTPRYGKLNALGYDRGDFVFQVGKPDVPSTTLATQSTNEAGLAVGSNQGHQEFRRGRDLPTEIRRRLLR